MSTKNTLASKGGKALLKKRGREWFSKIGKKGRRAQLKKNK